MINLIYETSGKRGFSVCHLWNLNTLDLTFIKVYQEFYTEVMGSESDPVSLVAHAVSVFTSVS